MARSHIVLLLAMMHFASQPESACLTIPGETRSSSAPTDAHEVQKKIDAAHLRGRGRVRLPAGVIEMGATPLKMTSNVCVAGEGIGVTVLRWSSAVRAINFHGTERACLKDLTISFASPDGVGIYITASDAALFRYNTIESVEIVFPQPPGTSKKGKGILGTSSGPYGTDIVLNTFRNVFVIYADQAISCRGCEGNYWQVTGQYLGGTNGRILAQWLRPSNDEIADLRLETGTYNASDLVCVGTEGGSNIMRITCDANMGQGVSALRDNGSYNIWDVDAVVGPTLGTVSATSSVRFVNFSLGVRIVHP